MHRESFIINRDTLLHVSTLPGHLQGKLLFAVTLGLHFTVEWEQARTTESSRLQKQRSTQSTAHSHSTVKCNLSVTVRKSSPWRWTSRVEICRSVLRLMIKLSLCICWWLVFQYIITLLSARVPYYPAACASKIKQFSGGKWQLDQLDLVL
jgi:hypothetical protein